MFKKNIKTYSPEAKIYHPEINSFAEYIKLFIKPQRIMIPLFILASYTAFKHFFIEKHSMPIGILLLIFFLVVPITILFFYLMYRKSKGNTAAIDGDDVYYGARLINLRNVKKYRFGENNLILLMTFPLFIRIVSHDEIFLQHIMTRLNQLKPQKKKFPITVFIILAFLLFLSVYHVFHGDSKPGEFDYYFNLLAVPVILFAIIKLAIKYRRK